MEHITITEKLSASGEVLYYRLYADEGYQIHCPFADTTLLDENGQPSLDEDGNEVVIPYYSNGIMVVRDYDFSENLSNFEAVRIEV